MEAIDINKKGNREFYSMLELVNVLRKNPIVWSWGAHAWTKMNKYFLRFKVNAHRHKGHIYICVNGADLFDIYLTTIRGNTVKVFNDVYVSDLIETIDNEIEKIPEYNF